MSPKNHRSSAKSEELEAGTERARPILHQKAREIQPFGKLTRMPIALDENVCAQSVGNLNQLLADTMTLRDMYKKHHWQVAGHTFYQLHLLFDKHHGEQDELAGKKFPCKFPGCSRPTSSFSRKHTPWRSKRLKPVTMEQTICWSAT